MKGALDRGSTFGGWLLHYTWKGGQASLVLIHPLNLSRASSKRHSPGPRLSRRAEPREGVMLTRHHWANDLHDAGYRPRRMKFPQELNGYVFKTKAGHLDGGHRLWSDMERDGLRHATLPIEKRLPQKATQIFFSGREGRQEHGVGSLTHIDTVNAIMGCRPVSSRLITILLKASPFNISII